MRRSKRMPTIEEMEEALRVERELSSHDHSALTEVVERIIEARKFAHTRRDPSKAKRAVSTAASEAQ